MKRVKNAHSSRAVNRATRIECIECVTAYNADLLADRMNELLAVGFIPQGSIAVCPIVTYENGDHGLLFTALMVQQL
jgi:hypothetical protein